MIFNYWRIVIIKIIRIMIRRNLFNTDYLSEYFNLLRIFLLGINSIFQMIKYFYFNLYSIYIYIIYIFI
jgi:hypothetical protein